MASSRELAVEAAGRASARAAAVVHGRLKEHLWALATVASVGPWVGVVGTIIGIANSFPAIGGQKGMDWRIPMNLSDALSPTCLGIAIAIVAFASYQYLSTALCNLEGEMDNARLELMNELSRVRLS